MITREEFFLPSSDGTSRLHAMCWYGDRPVRATLQISHGMTEHINRYDEFAEQMAEQGIAVIGHDHLGHGKTSETEEDLGFFAETGGAAYVIKDLHRVSVRMQHKYPQVPHFMLGHSMGSFFLRKYLTLYGHETDGAIIMGTGNTSAPLLAAATALTWIISKAKGDRYRSPLLYQLTLGNYNRRFQPVETESDWLSRDRDKVEEYIQDPYCNFRFTCSAYLVLFQILRDLKSGKGLRQIPKNLPVFLVSGKEDPVGNYGKGVTQVYRRYRNLGLTDVEMKLYPGGRHEILNEIDRELVYEDIASWLFDHLPD